MIIKKIPVKCYTRTVGYFAPTDQTNPGKQEEIRQRKTQSVTKLFNHRRFKDE